MRLVFISSVTAITPLRTISVTTGSALCRARFAAFAICPRRICSKPFVAAGVPRDEPYASRVATTTNRWSPIQSSGIRQVVLDLMPARGVPDHGTKRVAEGRMLDMSKYAEHFPDERQDVPSAQTTAAPAQDLAPQDLAPQDLAPPSPALLTALSQLEKEFSEILRTQQPESADGSE